MSDDPLVKFCQNYHTRLKAARLFPYVAPTCVCRNGCGCCECDDARAALADPHHERVLDT